MIHDDFASDPDDMAGLAAWVDDDGRFFAVGGDGIVREYGDAPGDGERLQADLLRQPPIMLPALASTDIQQLVHDQADTLAAEGIRTAWLCLAGLVTGGAVITAYDPAGAAARLVDFVRWWLL